MGNDIFYEQIKIEDLSINLTNFTGPLDLLLHLVKEEKIEIKDIFVSQVTEQFLSYMGQLNTVDIDKASEYMTMAATLLEIKSRALLPEIPDFDENAETPEKLLIRQLEEYKLFREVTERLKQKENVDRLFKQPSPEVNDVIYAVKDMSLDNLLDAFAAIMHHVELNKIEVNN
ncbi:MAG TPA: segregation/condensation protein A, partial [Clostridia bacterium]|nr:segregation/condensation protein A [Clostridia bacterium]